MSAANSLPILDAELKRLRDGAFEAWKIYMTWYTWFFGANLIVLGWILTNELGTSSARNIRVLATIWIIFNLIGVVSTLRLRVFSQHIATRADEICRSLNAVARDLNVKAEVTSGFAGRLGNWGAGANALSLGVNVLVWTYVLLYVPK